MQNALCCSSIQSVALAGLKQLCMQGGDVLRAEENFVRSFVETTHRWICDRPFDPITLKLVDIVVRFVSLMDISSATRHVMNLSQPAVEHLASVCGEDSVAPADVIGTLTLLAQVLVSLDPFLQ